MSPVRYEQGFYIPEDDILHSYRRENLKCYIVVFVVFVLAGCIVYVLAVVVSFIVVFLYCICASFVCNVCYLSVILLYYCHRVKAQLQFNIYIYIYINRLGFVAET
jgi:hypothetical protein